MTVETFENMIGRTMVSVAGDKGDARMLFKAEDGAQFVFWHQQDCCETVTIEDVCGDLSDLVGSPIVEAECVSEEEDGSGTFSFYKFATAKGHVTVRWVGRSNGYYSERVTYSESIPGDEPKESYWYDPPFDKVEAKEVAES